DRTVTGVQTCALPICPRPGEVEHEFAEGMRLDEGGGGGGEPAAIAERQVERLPARRPPHAMRALESQEELVAREGIGSCAEGVRSEERRVGKGWRTRA